MSERLSGRQGEARLALRVALVFALVPLLAAACGDDAGEDAAGQTPTVTETVGGTTTEAGTTTAATTTAPPPPTAPSGLVVRFAGSGDRVLPPVRVGRGGATVRWRNEDEVFTLFADVGLVADSVEAAGEGYLPPGRRELDVVASGAWSIEITNARRVR